MTSRAELLLSGPRGRRLCLELVQEAAGRLWPPLSWTDGPDGYPIGRFDPAAVRASLAADVSRIDLDAIGQPDRLLAALLASVDQARYWQPPDDADSALADPEVAALLSPVVEAVVRAPATQWWGEAVATGDQHVVGWPDEGVTVPPAVTGARSGLLQWRTDTLIDDARDDRPVDPTAPYSGHWWSTPTFAGVPVTTRARPGVAVDRAAPVGLLLVEDEMGWQSARTWPVESPPTARVHEISGPAAWTALVSRYPLDVSAARRHDWWQVTGWAGAWAIPDWAAVAEAFDAVHLTVDGYLSTAGRALPVELDGRPTRTLLGGWDPDATWWLTEILPPLGRPVDWRRRDDEPTRWELGG
ncbi:conserved protein of unknown function [Modestobacter italicus]|uniref:Uncharacterized protein n=1 Tax=Modestobacter italicus (strain DSM 44449 / CECT 9708 / BC 501) TaxID=2732864 RepID=I4EXC2_MODI5|nr:hypothetical protein [Modestobacter marinus]CCH88035.1 conserved protein of unknown function [Modestobacter marinus]